MFPRKIQWATDSANLALLRQRLDANGARLTPRQLLVLTARANLHGYGYRSFDEVGMLLGASRETVRRIERQALELLCTAPDLGPVGTEPADLPATTARRDTGPLVIEGTVATTNTLDQLDYLIARAETADPVATAQAQARAALLECFARTGDRLRQLRASWLAPFESEATRKAYARDFDQFLDYCIEHDLDPLAVRIQEFNLFTTWLRMQTTRSGKPYAVSSRARKINALSSFYNHLVDTDAIDRNPVTKAAHPSFTRRRASRVVTEEQTHGLIDDSLTGHRTLGPWCAALAIELLFTMGLRVSEVCNLDLDQLSWIVEDGKRYRQITFLGKGNKQHIRGIPAEVDELRLTPYLEHRPTPASLHDAPALLLTLDGKRVNRYQLNRLLERASSRLDLDRNVTPHFGRHTFNRRAEEAGVPIEDRQRALNHASVKTTQGYGEAENTVVNDPSHRVAARLHHNRAATDSYAEGA